MGLHSVKMPQRQLRLPASTPASPWASPQHSPWPSPWATPRNGSLEFDDLHFEGHFDPMQPAVRSQLLQKMRMQPNAVVEPMRGMQIGSCNAGMWVLRDSCQSFVLKLVRSGPAFAGHAQPSEAEKFAKLNREHPGIAQDPALAFPSKIFRCLGQGGAKTHDLVVMRHVHGLRVSDFIMQKLHAKQVPDLMHALEQFGAFLADFHRRYNGMQHGDLTPANIFFDQLTGAFTLVDVADLAPRNPIISSDVERFASSLKLLSHFYGPNLFMEGKAKFEAGYNARRSCMPVRAPKSRSARVSDVH